MSHDDDDLHSFLCADDCCRTVDYPPIISLPLSSPASASHCDGAGQDDEYSSAFVVHQHMAFQGVSNLDTLSFWTFR